MKSLIALLVALVLLGLASQVSATITPFIGEIRMFSGNFEPRSWRFCHGQILSIAENTALFSIIGTTYGGNGQTTFALPDLRGRVAMGTGQGAGLSPRTLGQMAGQETVTLTPNEMPAHTHVVRAKTGTTSTEQSPANNLFGMPSLLKPYATGSPDATMYSQTLSATGGSQPHTNLQPFTVSRHRTQ